jgi:hypothetical protein
MLRLVFAFLVLLAALPADAQNTAVTLERIDLVSSRPVTRTRYEFTYRVTVKFAVPPQYVQVARNLRGQVTSTAPATSIVDAELSFGDVPRGASSSDTFSLVQDRTQRFDRSALSFSFDYEPDLGTLPSLRGLTREQAVAELARCCNLAVYDTWHGNDPEVTPENVAYTDPPAGTPIAELLPSNSVNLYLSLGPDRTSQFRVTLAESEKQVEPGGSVGIRIRIERNPGFAEPISIELENPPSGYSSNALSVDQRFPTPRLTARASPSLPLFDVQELVVRATAAGESVHVPLRVGTIPRSPSSSELIQAALESGAIDLETSYVYRMYAMVGDPRLPSGFVGSGSSGEDQQLFLELEGSEGALRDETSSSLRPYLVRPAHPDSFWNQPLTDSAPAEAGLAAAAPFAATAAAVTILDGQPCPAVVQDPTWIHKRVTAGSTQALLWARCDPADPYLSQFTFDLYFESLSTKLGPMVELMGPPLSDISPASPQEPYNPDSAIDVYILPQGALVARAQSGFPGVDYLGFARPINVGAGVRFSSYLVVDDRTVDGGSSAQALLVHELFHMLQFSHNSYACASWMCEAGAEWAQTHFAPASEPSPHLEHFPSFRMNAEHLALSDPDPGFRGAYRSYIWFYFMQHQLGREMGAQAIAAAWRAFESLPPGAPLADYDAVLDGFFPYGDYFAEFARLNLMTAQFLPGDPLPYDQGYVRLEPSFPEWLPIEHPEATDSPDPLATFDADDSDQSPVRGDYGIKLRPLQIEHLFLSVTGINTKEVEVSWANLSSKQLLTVDKVARVRGQPYEIERVRGRDSITFCIPEGEESEALRGYLVFSNAAFRPEQGTATGLIRVDRRSQRTGACGCTGAQPDDRYCAERLSPVTARQFVERAEGINYHGWISGSRNTAQRFLPEPVIWFQPLQATSLLAPAETRGGTALRINDASQVAGYFLPESPPSGTLAGTGAFWPFADPLPIFAFFPIPLPTDPIAFGAHEFSIGLNNQDVVAYSTGGRVYLRQYRGSTYSEFDAGDGDLAIDVNEYNHVLIQEGFRFDARYPVSSSLWRSGVRTQLPFIAAALNDEDVVVGDVLDPSSPPERPHYRPARWEDGVTTPLALPIVPPPPPGYLPGALGSVSATDINNRGEIVGTALFRYEPIAPGPTFSTLLQPHGLYWSRDGEVIDLFYAVQRNANVVSVSAINERGWMAAQGFVSEFSSDDCQAPERGASGCIGVGRAEPIRLKPIQP